MFSVFIKIGAGKEEDSSSSNLAGICIRHHSHMGKGKGNLPHFLVYHALCLPMEAARRHNYCMPGATWVHAVHVGKEMALCCIYSEKEPVLRINFPSD